MKFTKIIIVTIIVCLFLTSCNTVGSGQNDYFGFKTSVFTVVDEKDTHGGFLGDGDYYLILDCSEAIDKSDDTNLFRRYSYNFSVAVYDLDTNTLYYFEFDT